MFAMEAKTRKSEATRAAIVDTALSIVAESGFSAVNMRAVADRLHVSKSCVFSRSGSIETLRKSVIEEYGRRFLADVFLPAMQKPRGLPRLDAIMLRWLERVGSASDIGSSIFEAAAFSLEPVEAQLREQLVEGVGKWRATMRRTITQAIDEGHLTPGLDPDVFMYELHSLVMGALYDTAFLGDTTMVAKGTAAYRRLIDAYRRQPVTTVA